jgi:hypothetical protein
LEIEKRVVKIRVRVQVGDSLLSASDDPLFLGIRGEDGREFRLLFHDADALRRSGEDVFVLGGPNDPETNVAHPEINDPNRPPLDATRITSVYLRKGFEPIPNVRALGEMDDRLELDWAEVEIDAENEPKAALFLRHGPIWLGLRAGLHFEIPRAVGSA